MLTEVVVALFSTKVEGEAGMTVTVTFVLTLLLILLVTVIVVLPIFFAVTAPGAETVATDSSDEEKFAAEL